MIYAQEYIDKNEESGTKKYQRKLQISTIKIIWKKTPNKQKVGPHLSDTNRLMSTCAQTTPGSFNSNLI